jgi:crotonobetainyl-CoA:carnitine CoA-transferase CaiB-like acyl-CoA transferase
MQRRKEEVCRAPRYPPGQQYEYVPERCRPLAKRAHDDWRAREVAVLRRILARRPMPVATWLRPAVSNDPKAALKEMFVATQEMLEALPAVVVQMSRLRSAYPDPMARLHAILDGGDEWLRQHSMFVTSVMQIRLQQLT